MASPRAARRPRAAHRAQSSWLNVVPNQAERKPEDVPYNALFTPHSIELLYNRNNAPYLRCRGLIMNRTASKLRTVMIHGPAFYDVTPVIQINVPIKLRGYYKTVPNPRTGTGEFFHAISLMQAFEAPQARQMPAKPEQIEEIVYDEANPIRRRRHKRTQRFGPGLCYARTIWVEATSVRRRQK